MNLQNASTDRCNATCIATNAGLEISQQFAAPADFV